VKKWFSGDERTLALFLAVGVMTMAFFRMHTVRDKLGVAQDPSYPLAVVLVLAALAWWSLLPRGFVWLDPAVLTWRDDTDRRATLGLRLAGGWVLRQVLLGYALAVLLVVVTAPGQWAVAGAAVLVGVGLLALAVVRRPRVDPHWEAAAVLVLAAAAVVVKPGPVVLYLVAAVAVLAALPLFRGGTVTNAGRTALVDGWRDRVLRMSGVQFLDLALLLPAARPVRPRPLTSGLRLAWLGVLGRARHVPTAVLLALAAIAARLAFPALPGIVLFSLLGYLALVPLVAGLGELWRSPGRRRWVGLSDTALRAHHLVVAVALAACWALPVYLLADWHTHVLVMVPVLAAATVRTMTRKAPTYDNLVPVDTPIGAMPIRLFLQTGRGMEVGVVAAVLIPASPWWGQGLVVAAVVALAVFR
jgi:hypothetical protein